MLLLVVAFGSFAQQPAFIQYLTDIGTAPLPQKISAVVGLAGALAALVLARLTPGEQPAPSSGETK